MITYFSQKRMKEIKRSLLIPASVYVDKIERNLRDETYYKKTNKNPFNLLKNGVARRLESWKNKGVFDLDDSFQFINTKLENNHLLRAYGLITIHKKFYTVKIIVSAVNSPLYSFDKYLSKFLYKYVSRPEHSVKNSTKQKNLLEGTFIPAD